MLDPRLEVWRRVLATLYVRVRSKGSCCWNRATKAYRRDVSPTQRPLRSRPQARELLFLAGSCRPPRIPSAGRAIGELESRHSTSHSRPTRTDGDRPMSCSFRSHRPPQLDGWASTYAPRSGREGKAAQCEQDSQRGLSPRLSWAPQPGEEMAAGNGGGD